jgi:YrbI family 3-deoxy-D-manno-octulosonate 8-phosphate phosphatase
MNILVLIPARGGSKSITRKNIRLFAGHPLLAYSIAAGLQAKTVTRVIVSTDDDEIAAIANRYKAETPFMRPKELAQDKTTDLPVFIHALDWLLHHEGYQPEVVVQLRPTSPIRPPSLVDDAVHLLLTNPVADSVRGVVSSGQNPYKMWNINDQGHLVPLLRLPGISEPYNAPRQSLPPTYWQTGHIDAIRVSALRLKNSLSGDIILPLVIDPSYMVDIDSERDWQRAEWMISDNKLEIVHPSHRKRPLPEQVHLVVLDFDGVMTDDRVWVDQQGNEMVAANRGDGMGIAALRHAGIPIVVLSTEVNPVVAARCAKLELPVMQGISDKALALRTLLEERQVNSANVVYLGNDVNDVPCFPLVGCALVVSDAHPSAIDQADIVLDSRGGHGAVRELCDRIIYNQIRSK